MAELEQQNPQFGSATAALGRENVDAAAAKQAAAATAEEAAALMESDRVAVAKQAAANRDSGSRRRWDAPNEVVRVEKTTAAEKAVTAAAAVTPPPELLVAKQAIAVPNKPALKIVPDTVVAETLKVFREHKSDETFVEVDAKSQSQAKSKSKSKSKAKAKMKFFFASFSGGFFNSFSDSCDSSRRRRADEDPRKGDPDCSGTDCQRGLSRRRRSNDCQDVSVDSCFPASTQVETESRGAVEMKEVLLGERIKTAGGFSEVKFVPSV